MALCEREVRATVFDAPTVTPLTSTVTESSLWLVVAAGLERPEVAQRAAHDGRLRARPGRRVGARRRGQDGGGERACRGR